MSTQFCPIVDNYVIYRGKKIPLTPFYSNYAADQPPEYYNYENIEVNWSSPHGIYIIKKIGRGKYSEVFEGTMTQNDDSVTQCIIKILKPVKKKKIRREISIMSNLQNGPNIVKLLEVVKDPVSKTSSLVVEKIDNIDFRRLFPRLSNYDIRYYIYHLLVALDFCNSRGIMHRDVKPHNIIIDNNKRELRLIDWGLAEYYIPGKCYNVRVASRYYKAPELLVDFQAYDYSLDMWSVGCILAGIIFNTEPFFCGADNYDQLVKIVEILGTKEFVNYVKKYNIVLSRQINTAALSNQIRKPWNSFITESQLSVATEDAIDLLDKLLRYDHTERLLPKQAMEHPYFDIVRDECNRKLAEQAARN